jgi:hypothetical protein
MKRKLSPDTYFYFCNGEVARNIEEIIAVLDNLSQKDFKHHVTKNKNDIASWISGVYKRSDIAQKIDKKTNKKAIVRILRKALSNHEKEQRKAKKRVEKIIKKHKKNYGEHESHVTKEQLNRELRSYEKRMKFLVKEFLWGLALGFAVGLIIAAVLVNMGV